MSIDYVIAELIRSERETGVRAGWGYCEECLQALRRTRVVR